MGQDNAQDQTAAYPRSLGGWWRAARNTWAEANEDNLTLIAAGIAFDSFLAMVPLLTAAVLSYGLFASPEQMTHHIAALAQALPEQAANTLAEQLSAMADTSDASTGLGLALVLGIAIFAALRGASGIMTGLNMVFDIEESRGFLHRYAVALAITVGLVLLFLIASIGISMVNLLAAILPNLGGATQEALQIAFWISAAVVMSLVISQIYVLAPNRPIRWRWLTPGSAVATVMWIAATLAFSFYVENFGNYNAMYGALGAVIVFLTWLYLSAYILLLGAELNQVLSRR